MTLPTSEELDGLEPKRIDQTEFGQYGNCMSACLAMVLGLRLGDIPNFTGMRLTDIEHHAEMQKWLNARGFGMLTFNKWDGDLWPPKGYCIGGGMASRGFLHAVVLKDGELWHDPHPDREGVSLETVDIIYPLNPSLIEAAREVERLRAENAELLTEVREWVCVKCNTVYPGPPQEGFRCIVCPKCGGNTVKRSSIGEVALLRAELAKCQKIAAHVPGDIYIRAREQSGFGEALKMKEEK